MHCNSHLIWPFVLMICLSSCVNHRELINFRKGEETTISGYQSTIDLPKLTVQPDDILYITVNSLDDRASAPYNIGGSQQGGGAGGGGAQNQNIFLLQGYAVDSAGYIDMPNIGRVLVNGLTLEGVRDQIAQELEIRLPNAAINVKFLNFRYTVLGDVALPGTYTTISERVSLLEALGTAGDLTPYANRQNVFVIREEDNLRTVQRIDLQTHDFFESPYYYLRQNDVVYVEPLQAKVATVADPASRFISYGSAFLSIITLTLTILRFRE